MRASWFSKNLGDAMLAGEELARIERLFESAHVKAGRPKDMTIYIRHESEGRLHCEVVIYLSPAAIDLAREVGANSCTRPYWDESG
jgi:hypothetical protein